MHYTRVLAKVLTELAAHVVVSQGAAVELAAARAALSDLEAQEEAAAAAAADVTTPSEGAGTSWERLLQPYRAPARPGAAMDVDGGGRQPTPVLHVSGRGSEGSAVMRPDRWNSSMRSLAAEVQLLQLAVGLFG
jgi:hypothetical protein